MKGLQPVKLHVVSELKDELIDYPINAHRPADELQGRVGRVIEDEVMAIEIRQRPATDATS